MPKSHVEKTEEMGGYASITERRLQVGTLIERVGSYSPPKRKGYDDSRTEQRIIKKVAHHLYDRRLVISRNLVQSPHEKKSAIVNGALLSGGLAPNSLPGWGDYLSLLASREGGWDIFLEKLRNDVEGVDYYQKSIVMGWLSSLIALIYTFMIPYFFSDIAPDMVVYGLYGSLISMAAVVMIRSAIISKEASAGVRYIIGPRIKHIDAFVEHNKIASMM